MQRVMSSTEVRALFLDWGFVSKGINHGREEMEWPPTGHKVSIIAPGRIRHQHQQDDQVKTAARLLGMSVREFLNGRKAFYQGDRPAVKSRSTNGWSIPERKMTFKVADQHGPVLILEDCNGTRWVAETLPGERLHRDRDGRPAKSAIPSLPVVSESMDA